jgi:hypothetical protein
MRKLCVSKMSVGGFQFNTSLTLPGSTKTPPTDATRPRNATCDNKNSHLLNLAYNWLVWASPIPVSNSPHVHLPCHCKPKCCRWKPQQTYPSILETPYSWDTWNRQGHSYAWRTSRYTHSVHTEYEMLSCEYLTLESSASDIPISNQSWRKC